MKKSELVKTVREELQGYSKYIGKTKGGTPDEFMQILTAMAKGADQEKYEGDAERGNAILDKANPDNVARITRGEDPIYEEASNIESIDISYAYPGNRLYSITINGKKALDREEAVQTVQNLTGLEVPSRAWFDDKEVLAIVNALKAKGIQASSSEMDVS
jgi:hypothetical protein